MKKSFFILILITLTTFCQSFAQIGFVDGNSNVFVGEQVNYVFQNDFELFAGNWEVSGGTIVWENNNPSTYRYEVGVYWGVTGTGIVRFKDGGYEVSVLSVTVNPNPSPPTSVINGSRCGPGTITLSATPSANANTIRWYSSSSGGSPLHTGTSYIVNLNSTTTYYASSYNSDFVGRESAGRTAVSATINAIPSVPSATDGTVCGSGQVLLMASPGANGNQVRWYEDDMNFGWTYLDSGPSYMTPNISTGRTYYAATSNTTTGCESSTTTVNAVITPIPGLPTPIDNNRCGPGEMLLGGGSGANGNTVRWYHQDGSILATGANYSIPYLPSTTTYYITSYNSNVGCESAKVGVTATINPVPQTPSFSNASRCGSGQITLAVSPGSGGDDVKWFSTPSEATLVTTGLIYQPSLSSTTTYYVSSLNTAGYCESARVPIVATIYTIPTVAVSAASQATCSNQAMTPVTITNPNGVSGTTFSWSVSAPNIAGASSGTSSTIAQTLAQTTSTNQTATYTVTPIANGCSGTSVQHSVTVKPIPTAALSLATQSICSEQGMTSVSISNPNAVSGTTFSWAVSAPNIAGTSSGSGSSLGQTLSQTSSVNQTALYTIVPVAASCSGAPVVHTVTVKPKPTVAATPSSQSICSGQAVAPVSLSNPNNVSGTTFAWTVSAPSVSGASIGSGTSISQTLSQSTSSNQTATYTITPTAAGCNGLSTTAVVTVYRILDEGVLNSVPAICNGQSPAVLTSTVPVGGTGSYTYQWEQSNDGISWANATGISTGSTYAPGMLTNSTHYRRKATSCSTFDYTNAVMVVVNATSVGGIISSNQETYGAASGTLTLSGYTGSIQKWQQKIGSGSWTDIANTSTTQPYTNISDTRYYRAVVQSGVCVEAPSSEASIIVHPIPVITFNGQNAIPPAGSTQLSTTSGLYSYQWYKNNVAINGATAATVVVTTPGDYKVIVQATLGSGAYATEEVDVENSLDAPHQDMNYVRTITYSKAGIQEATDLYTLAPVDYTVSTNYFDGLGRPVQSVTLGGGANGHDLIQSVAYDAFGRESKKYLPYVHEARDGRYQPTALVAQSVYYTTADKIAHDTAAFSETIFEPSPLNRVVKQGAPGTAWQPDENQTYASADHTVKFAYEFNGSNEVLLWTYTLPTTTYPLGSVNAGTSNTVRFYYAANQLYKNKTKDEQQNEVIEYIDKKNRVVLKRVQAVAGAVAVNDVNYASTYYIYDKFGNLVCVIPPEATKRITQTSPVSEYLGTSVGNKESFLARWCFRYTYDARKRMSQKQVPGAGAVYMVYDKRDRLVMTQDGNQRTPKRWLFTKYDALNRPVSTGIHVADSILVQSKMQRRVDLYYAAVPGNNGAWFETYSNTNPDHGYDNKSYPPGTISNNYLTVTYYDNYDFRNQWNGNYAYVNEGLSAEINGTNYLQNATEFLRVKSLVTGTKTKVLDGGVVGGYSWLKSVNYYDDKYRVIQSNSTNHTGGVERTSHVYDFAGKLLTSKTTHSMVWKDAVGVDIAPNSITKLYPGSSWSNAGAASISHLPAGQDGWLEVVVSETDTHRMIGLSSVNLNAHYTSIGYAIYQYGAQLYIYEDGNSAGQKGAIVSGDVLRVQREGTTIKYYRNGNLVYTSLRPSTTDLYVDAALNQQNSTLKGIRFSFETPTNAVVRRFSYDHAGRLINTWHKLNNNDEVLLAHNDYNELGQLIDKSLHLSYTGGNAWAQSIDYRYTIRGWLESINNAQLTVDNANDDPDGYRGDYFGMNLAYDEVFSGINNAAQFNGNISATKWSNHYGLSGIKENAYNYTYDAMNRLKTADFKQKAGSTWGLAQYRDANGSMQGVNAFSEHISEYDLNGNIKFLQRRGQDGQLIDDLTYNYGSTTGVLSNKLMRVTDAAIDTEGFKEVANTASDDYAYDTNGNLVWDRNKGGKEALTNGDFDDGSANWIVADETTRATFVNEELQITAGTSGVTLTQQGAVILASKLYVVVLDIENTSGTGQINVKVGNTATSVYSTGLVVLTVTAGAGSTFEMIPSAAWAGTIKSVSVKGIAVITYNYLNLPETVMMGKEGLIRYIYTATGQKLAQVVLDKGITKRTDYSGEYIYQNDTLQFINHEEGRVVMTGDDPEYQYHLKDHLGNVRITFTTKEEIEAPTATLETTNESEERSNFLKYDDIRKVNSRLFDHTDTGSTQYAMRLSGTPSETYGLARSMAVMPGDVITAEVFAKYVDLSNPDLEAFLLDFVADIVAGTTSPGVVRDGGTFGSPEALTIPFGTILNKSSEAQGVPKAYLNWIVFDKNFRAIDSKSGYRRVTIAAKEDGSLDPANGLEAEGFPHEPLSTPTIEITEPGYVYIYLSNEEEGTEVYFDDFTVTHTKSPVIQSNDYYPFGLTFNSYSRENSFENKYLFNSGSELQTDLNLGFYSTLFRTYDPAIGRFMQIDPLADFFAGITPYSFAFDNPISYSDPDGLAPMWWLQLRANVKQAWYNVTGRGNQHAVVRPRNPIKSGVTEVGARTAGQRSTTNPRTEQVARTYAKEEPQMQADPVSPQQSEPVPVQQSESIESTPPSDPVFRGRSIPENKSITFSDQIQFQRNTDHYMNNSSNSKIISDLVKTLKDYPQLKMFIVGNVGTDFPGQVSHYGNTPDALNQMGELNGRPATFGAVMKSRAKAIYDALVKSGIDPSRLDYGTGNVYPTPKGRITSFILKN